MPSVVGWLDQSEAQQRKMREVIALFAESGTVDDIGIGAVRDAFSDLLFPGLSTVQTRVRYFLFVPWVFQRLDLERVSSARAVQRAREWEIELIFSLMRGGAAEGVIGRDAQAALKQLPSYIYWNGLRSFGIRLFSGSRADYFGSMDHINRVGRAHRAEGDDPPVDDARRWQANLPVAPPDLWDSTTLDLAAEEAAFLQERFVASHPDSLLAHLARAATPVSAEVPFPWDAVEPKTLPAPLAATLEMARYFSEVIHGASLLYNLLLAEASAARQLPMAIERQDHYRQRLSEWQAMVDVRRPAHESVDRHEFWSIFQSSGANIPWSARQFINGWLEAVAAGVDIAASDELRRVIRERERRLKKGLARLSNDRALETWGGASGVARLDYRWTEGKAAVNDIVAGLGTT